MSYIGRGVDAISNVEKLDNITFDGSTTYNLTKSSVAFTPSGANNILISIDGVVQQGNFSVAGATIIFDWSPTSSNTCNWIQHYGTGVLNVPADGSITASKMGANSVDSDSYVDGSIDAVHLSANSVTTAKITDGNITADKLGADSVNATKIADDSISDEHLDITAITGQTEKTSLVDADKFLISDSATSGALKYVQKSNLGAGGMILISEVATTDVLTVTMDNVFTTDYDNYLLTYTNINFATADDNFGIRLLDTSGTQQTSYFYSYIGYKDGTTGMEGSNGGAISYAVPFYINSVDLDSASSQGISGFTYIMNPRITGGTYFVSQAGARNGANNAWAMNNTWWASNATYQARGMKLEGMAGTSNFDTYGKFRLYGITGTG